MLIHQTIVCQIKKELHDILEQLNIEPLEEIAKTLGIKQVTGNKSNKTEKVKTIAHNLALRSIAHYETQLLLTRLQYFIEDKQRIQSLYSGNRNMKDSYLQKQQELLSNLQNYILKKMFLMFDQYEELNKIQEEELIQKYYENQIFDYQCNTELQPQGYNWLNTQNYSQQPIQAQYSQMNRQLSSAQARLDFSNPSSKTNNGQMQRRKEVNEFSFMTPNKQMQTTQQRLEYIFAERNGQTNQISTLNQNQIQNINKQSELLSNPCQQPNQEIPEKQQSKQAEVQVFKPQNDSFLNELQELIQNNQANHQKNQSNLQISAPETQNQNNSNNQSNRQLQAKQVEVQAESYANLQEYNQQVYEIFENQDQEQEQNFRYCYKCWDIVDQGYTELINPYDQDPPILYECVQCQLCSVNPLSEVQKMLSEKIYKIYDPIDKSPTVYQIEFQVNMNEVNQNNNIEVRCIKADSQRIYESEFPPSYSIKVNNEKQIKETIEHNVAYRRKDFPINITHFLRNKISKPTQKLKFTVYFDKFVQPSKYYFGVFLSKQISNKGVIQNKFINNLSVKQSVNVLIESFRTNEIESETFSANCQYLNKPIKNPGRGKLCKHFQCFDIDKFFTLNQSANEKSRNWVCPICQKRSVEIIKDQFFELILNELTEEEQKLQLNIDQNLIIMTSKRKLQYVSNIDRIVELSKIQDQQEKIGDKEIKKENEYVNEIEDIIDSDSVIEISDSSEDFQQQTKQQQLNQQKLATHNQISNQTQSQSKNTQIQPINILRKEVEQYESSSDLDSFGLGQKQQIVLQSSEEDSDEERLKNNYKNAFEKLQNSSQEQIIQESILRKRPSQEQEFSQSKRRITDKDTSQQIQSQKPLIQQKDFDSESEEFLGMSLQERLQYKKIRNSAFTNLIQKVATQKNSANKNSQQGFQPFNKQNKKAGL